MNKIEELLGLAKKVENETEIEQFCELLAQLDEAGFEQFFKAWDAESQNIRQETYQWLKDFKISEKN